jgi:gluconolactonase
MLNSSWPVLSGYRFLFLLIGVLCSGSTSAAEEPIVPANAKLEKLFESKVLTEGVCVAPDGMVYFSEITFSNVSRDENGAIDAGYIWKFDPSTKETSIFRSPSGMSNGIKFDAAGNMIVAEGADYGGRRVTRTDMKTGKSKIIAALFEGRPLNSPNDITIDEKGRIYFSDPRYLGHEAIDQPVVGVYRIDPDGSLHRIITDAGKANGVCVSPDQKTLYVVSNDNGGTAIERLADPNATEANKVGIPLRKGLMALLAYDLADDGSAKFRKVLVDYAPFDGPDGLVVDQGWQSVCRGSGRKSSWDLCVFTGRKRAGVHSNRSSDQRWIRSRQRHQSAVHHRRFQPVQHSCESEGYHLPSRLPEVEQRPF